MEIRDRLNAIKETLNPGVNLVAVSKTKPVEDIMAAYEAGQRIFGENKVQELMDKVDQLPADISWHFIGALQRNKVKYLDQRIALIHSLDRLSLAQEIQKQASKKGYVQDVLLEINIGREANKAGVLPEDFADLAEQVRSLSAIRVRGLMAIIPDTDDEGEQRSYFKAMKEIFDQEAKINQPNYQMEILSMGMSGDYKAAMAEGSNLVRIGSAIFGPRNY